MVVNRVVITDANICEAACMYACIKYIYEILGER